MRDPEGRMLGMITGGQRYNAATDAQNSTLALAEDGTTSTDPEVAYDYDPYGEADTTTNNGGDTVAEANPFTYTGAYAFTNGDKALGHRYMSHFTERFTQQDPSRQENNLYGYAAGDPINNTDPSGLLSFAGTVGTITGTVLGGAAAAGVAGMCVATAVVACAAGAAVAGGLYGAVGGGAGALIAGGSQAQARNAMWYGMVGGMTTGAGKAIGYW
ncbi:RHS repeat-associated core domain-containing protein [Haloactinospora alba]|uniref:RHS repeat-associated core domain-containing protein n=1 Tax=Haloactinospora alba TaxID=405555 RepID=UPI00114D7E38|nr:RHS repeat-associated core domain-containing protein [Haloactinospora alba]